MKVRLDSLVPHPANGRKGNVKAIRASLERFGQMKPIVVQESTRYIIAGNHTAAAAQELGWEEIDVELKDVNDEEALAYLMADNRTSDLARYNANKQLANMRQISLLEGTGYDETDLENLEIEVEGSIVEEDTGDVIFVPVDDSETAPDSTGDVPKREPLRDIVLLMPQAQALEFGAQVSKLRTAWELTKVVDVVRRAVDEAVTRLDS